MSEADELRLLRARAAYVLSHGGAFEQAVMRGEKDHALGLTTEPLPGDAPRV